MEKIFIFSIKLLHKYEEKFKLHYRIHIAFFTIIDNNNFTFIIGKNTLH